MATAEGREKHDLKVDADAQAGHVIPLTVIFV